MNFAMKCCLFFFIAALLAGCGSPNKLKKYYTPEDNTVFELVEKIRKQPGDKESIELLPQAYKTAADKRKALNEANYPTLPPGDRYMKLAKEYGVMQQMYDQISAVANKIIPGYDIRL